jgi:pimeloyl-ACP methyl ester carboxylesterase
MSRYPALSPINLAIPAADGLILRGTLTYPHGHVGTRYPLAVMAHQYPSTHESFQPVCADLHALGIATLAFDMRGQGKSIWSGNGARVAPSPADPTMQAFGEAFMGSAKSVGFANIADDIVRMTAYGVAQNYIDPTRVMLVGSSVGGTGVLLAAPRLKQHVRAIVTLCAAGAPAHGPDAQQQVGANCKSLDTPMLLASSDKDPFGGGDHVREWSKGLKHVIAKIVPGADHGTAIYYDVRADVIAFVKKQLGTAARARPLPRAKTTRR